MQERISVLCVEGVPVGVPLVAVHQTAESGHAVHAADAPTRPGLFEAASDEVLAGTFDLSAADRTPFAQVLGVIQVLDVRSQVVL